MREFYSQLSQRAEKKKAAHLGGVRSPIVITEREK